MGTPEYAKKILQKLFEQNWIEIVAVYTQPDKKAGRDMQISQSSVKIFALENNLKIFQPEKLKNCVDEVRNLNPDFIVVSAYGQILTRDILNIAPSINLHASILPKYRGASPIQESLINGDSETGVTAMLMNEGLDSGDILGISRIKIQPHHDLINLLNELGDLASNLTIDILKNYQNIKPLAQHGADSTRCKKIDKNDGLVSFANGKKLIKKAKAFSGWPSIYLENGLKLIDVDMAKNGNFTEGEILEINKNSIEIGCRDCSIIVESVQPPSKAKMNTVSYINGKRLKKGDIFK